MRLSSINCCSVTISSFFAVFAVLTASPNDRFEKTVPYTARVLQSIQHLGEHSQNRIEMDVTVLYDGDDSTCLNASDGALRLSLWPPKYIMEMVIVTSSIPGTIFYLTEKGAHAANVAIMDRQNGDTITYRGESESRIHTIDVHHSDVICEITLYKHFGTLLSRCCNEIRIY